MIRRIAKAILPRDITDAVGKFYELNVSSGVYDGRLTPEHLRQSLAVWQILNHEQGYMRSQVAWQCLDGQGKPVPWYTYPAIEYLSALDFAGKHVFEFGSGASTLWWGERAQTVTSVEAEPEWHAKIAPTMPVNCSLIFEPEKFARYADAILRTTRQYDVIVIDGPGHAMIRYRCAEAALKRLKPGGMIILDNSDVLPKTVQLLQGAGLIYVPFSGLVPLNAVAGTTACFLRRDFSIPAVHRLAVGGSDKNWEAE